MRAQVAEHELQLDLTDEAKELLADKGWDPAMGARPLRRAIQRYIEDPLADEVLRAGPDRCRARRCWSSATSPATRRTVRSS